MGNDNIGRVPAGFKGRERDQFLPDFENLPDFEKMIQEMIQEKTETKTDAQKPVEYNSKDTTPPAGFKGGKTKQFTNPNGDQ